MEVKILKSEKEELECEVPNVTLAEVLKSYLNQDSEVQVAVWKRTHIDHAPILLVRTKGKTAKKAVDDAIKSAVKDLDKALKDFEKLK